MTDGLSITIWDHDPARLATIDHNLHRAAQSLHLVIRTFIIAEPPLMARERLLERVPVLEIDCHYWSLQPGECISEAQCRRLLSRYLTVPAQIPFGA